jgi:hypothetical protein
MFCAITNENVDATFLFLVNTVIGNSYPYVTTLRLLTHLEDVFIQPAETSTRFHMAVAIHMRE